MPRQKEDRDLIDHFFGPKPVARHRVRRRHNLGCQIIGRSTSMDLGRAAFGQRGNQRADLAGGGFGLAAMQPRHPARQGQEGRKIEDRLAALIITESLKHLTGKPMLDRDRKQGAEDHIGGGMAHLCLDLHLALGQTRHRRLPRRKDRRKSIAQSPPFKGRIDDAALPFPDRAIGHKNRIAQKRAQPLTDPVGFREIARTLLQHAPDQCRIVAKIAAKEGRAKFRHPGPIQARGLCR